MRGCNSIYELSPDKTLQIRDHGNERVLTIARTKRIANTLIQVPTEYFKLYSMVRINPNTVQVQIRVRMQIRSHEIDRPMTPNTFTHYFSDATRTHRVLTGPRSRKSYDFRDHTRTLRKYQSGGKNGGNAATLWHNK